MIGFDLPICFCVVVDFLFLNLVTREICEIYANLSESKLHAEYFWPLFLFRFAIAIPLVFELNI